MSAGHLLIVEDEPLLLEILQENLEEGGYDTVSAESGEAAWQRICDAKHSFDAIILDRLMPDMDGIEILRRIKSSPDLEHVPVIMQTSLTSEQDINEGLKAGAYYYLTKPISAEALLAIVGQAIHERRNFMALQEEVKKTSGTLQLLQSAQFHFRTREQARALATLAAHAAPEPQRVVLGLSELLLNAVEHGNLGITYAEKSALLQNEQLEQEIQRRLLDPQFKPRLAHLVIRRTTDSLYFEIRDEGQGFDWHKFLEICPERAFDTHGRGIAMAKMLSFDTLEYLGNGNTVVASIKL